MKLVILAGGSGTRLWPVSRRHTPKQVQPFIDDDTLLQKTYRRLTRGFDKNDIYIVTGETYVVQVLEQLPEFPRANVIIEPEQRDTAAAIGLAAVHFYNANPEEIMVNVHADHFIKNEDEYIRILKQAEAAVRQKPDQGVLIGIKPTYPETGYGYIKMDSQVFSLGTDAVFRVEQFIEKPDAARAQDYLSKWEYLWNPGYFTWRVDTLLRQYETFLPEQYRRLMAIAKLLPVAGTAEAQRREFTAIPPIAIDYGIIERAENLLVIPADFGFTDIGHWRAIKDIVGTGGQNAIKGCVICIDSSNNLIYNFTDSAVALAGVHDMIVVVTDDATLICREDAAHAVKTIVAQLRDQGLARYL